MVVVLHFLPCLGMEGGGKEKEGEGEQKGFHGLFYFKRLVKSY